MGTEQLGVGQSNKHLRGAGGEGPGNEEDPGAGGWPVEQALYVDLEVTPNVARARSGWGDSELGCKSQRVWRSDQEWRGEGGWKQVLQRRNRGGFKLATGSLAGVAQWIETKRSLVRFPLRAHAWVACQVPIWRPMRSNQSMYLSHIHVSLLLFLPPFSLSINK